PLRLRATRFRPLEPPHDLPGELLVAAPRADRGRDILDDRELLAPAGMNRNPARPQEGPAPLTRITATLLHASPSSIAGTRSRFESYPGESGRSRRSDFRPSPDPGRRVGFRD